MNARSLVIAALMLAASSAWAQGVRRPGGSEIYLSPIFTDSKNYNFQGGSTAHTDTGFGLALGYDYNLSQKLQLGGELSWSEANYHATVQPGTGNLGSAQTISATMNTWTARFLGNYNFTTRPFTPFVSGGLGWSTIDTNIPTGLPQGVCWWYPWYGEYCTGYVPTATTTKFSYNGALGLRYDFGKGFIRGQINSQWVDFGGNYGTDRWTQYRLDFGTSF